jgi:hypothetical protein
MPAGVQIRVLFVPAQTRHQGRWYVEHFTATAELSQEADSAILTGDYVKELKVGGANSIRLISFVLNGGRKFVGGRNPNGRACSGSKVYVISAPLLL